MGSSFEVLVTVIIPTHNRSSLLSRALQSVLSQSIKDFEVIVVDDDSSDGTQELMESWCEQEPKLRYIRCSPNIGAAAARNRALEQAVGRFICFLDDDDEWFPEKLERQVPLAESYSIVGCLSRRVDGYKLAGMVEWSTDKREHSQSPDDTRIVAVDLEDVFFNNGRLSPSCVMVRKDYLLAVGGFDEELVASQGRDLFVRLIKNFGDAVLIEEHLAKHYQRHGLQRITTSPNHLIGGWSEFHKNSELMSENTKQWRQFVLCSKELRQASSIKEKVRWLFRVLRHFRFWRLSRRLKFLVRQVFVR